MKKRFLFVLLCLVFILAGCGDHSITVSFEREPSAKSNVVSDLSEALSAQGIAVTSSAWNADNTVALYTSSEQDRATFEKLVDVAMDSFNPTDLPRPSMVLSLTESDKSKLDYFHRESGQSFLVKLDWKNAEYGNYITATQVDSMREIENATRRCICAVKVPLLGRVPAFVLVDAPVKTELLNEIATLSPAMQKLYLEVITNQFKLQYRVGLEGVDEADSPWDEAMFIGRKPTEETLIKDEGGAYYVEDDGNQFSYLIFGSNELSALGLASNGTGYYVDSTTTACAVTEPECGELIREKSGGDFFGATAYGAMGNVKSYRVSY
ncbi:MAG: hypothetical protein P8171_15290 [Candidatus Thiodiazotropha sp.]